MAALGGGSPAGSLRGLGVPHEAGSPVVRLPQGHQLMKPLLGIGISRQVPVANSRRNQLLPDLTKFAEGSLQSLPNRAFGVIEFVSRSKEWALAG